MDALYSFTQEGVLTSVIRAKKHSIIHHSFSILLSAKLECMNFLYTLAESLEAQ